MNKLDNDSIIGIAALLVHAAKIDEKYSESEKKIILKFIKTFIADENKCKDVLLNAEKLESNSNQLLNFTNIIKKNSIDIKKNVIEELWKIIISDNAIDEYESNLVRRICGLIYFPDKLSSEIKLKLLNKNT